MFCVWHSCTLATATVVFKNSKKYSSIREWATASEHRSQKVVKGAEEAWTPVPTIVCIRSAVYDPTVVHPDLTVADIIVKSPKPSEAPPTTFPLKYLLFFWCLCFVLQFSVGSL